MAKTQTRAYSPQTCVFAIRYAHKIVKICQKFAYARFRPPAIYAVAGCPIVYIYFLKNIEP